MRHEQGPRCSIGDVTFGYNECIAGVQIAAANT